MVQPLTDFYISSYSKIQRPKGHAVVMCISTVHPYREQHSNPTTPEITASSSSTTSCLGSRFCKHPLLKGNLHDKMRHKLCALAMHVLK